MLSQKINYFIQNKQLIVIFILGIFSGLPLALTGSTLSAWLLDSEMNKSVIGIFAIIATPYSLKFLWSSLVDNIKIPVLYGLLGRRRSWLLVLQILMSLLLFSMSMTTVSTDTLYFFGILGFMVAITSATMDIVIDAYRVESLPPEDQGFGAACAVFGYRVGMLISSAGALYLADLYDWSKTYMIMAMVTCSGVICTVAIKSPKIGDIVYQAMPFAKRMINIAYAILIISSYFILYLYKPIISQYKYLYFLIVVYLLFSFFLLVGIVITVISGNSLKASVLQPFLSFVENSKQYWYYLLLFIVFYKLCDAFLGSMTYAFLYEMNFTKTEIATYVKLYGFVATIAGAFAGGLLIKKVNIHRAMVVCVAIQMASNLVFILQSYARHNTNVLALVITVENFSSSMGGTAMVAFISMLCNVQYTATQYALLSSLAAFSRTFLTSVIFGIDQYYFPDSSFIDVIGWNSFFVITSLSSIPAFILLAVLRKHLNYKVELNNK